MDRSRGPADRLGRVKDLLTPEMTPLPRRRQRRCSTRSAAATAVIALSLLVSACADKPATETVAPSSPQTTARATTLPPGTTTPSPPSSQADIIFHNGTIVTVDAGFTIAGAVGVRDGAIVAVGDDEAVLAMAGPSTRLVDLEGRTLMPGIVDPHIHQLQHAAHEGSAALAGAEQWLIINGRTTVGSPTIEPDVLALLQEHAASADARLRHHVYLSYNTFCNDVLGHWYQDIEFDRDPALRFAIAGIKLFLDGGACAAPAVSFDWHTHRWEGMGDLFVDAAEVADILRTADDLGAQVVMHTGGDRALESGLGGLTEVIGDGPNPNRHRLDHLMVVRPDQLQGLASVAAPLVLFGTHQTCLDTEDSSVVRYLDEETLPWLEQRRDIIDSTPDRPPAWHSDTPLLGIDIFEHLAGLTGIGDRLGSPEGGDCEREELRTHAVTTEEAIRMMTIGAAYAMDLESVVGSIEVGKDADFIVLTHNPLAFTAEQHLENTLEATIIAGEVAWCTGGFCDNLSNGANDTRAEELPASTGECVVPPAGIVGWWPADGSAADIIAGRDGALVDGASTSDGLVEGSFTVAGGAIALESPPEIDAGFTIETWIRLDGTAAGDFQTIFNNDRFFLRKNDATEGNGFAIFVKLADGSVEPRAQSSTTAEPGRWTHVAATWDGTELRIHVDGVLEGSSTRSGRLFASTAPWQIGRGEQEHVDGPQFFGQIDEFTLYDVALSEDVIASIHAAGAAGKCKA